MSKRIFGSGLRAAVPVGNVIARSQATSVRCFSASAIRHAHAIQFGRCSTPELDQQLETIRTGIFLPSYLPLEQRKKLFSKKWEPKLRVDPITMEVNGETIKYTYRSLMSQPNTHESVRNAVELMKTKGDFHNLPRLLEGLYNATRRISPRMYLKMIQRAGNHDQIFTILECARSHRRTGFLINSHEKATAILHQIQRIPLENHWSIDSTQQAVKWTRTVAEMLEDDAHQPRFGKWKLSTPLYRDPFIVGAKLHIYAGMALKHRKGVDKDDEVKLMARDLVQMWPADKGLQDIHSDFAVLYQGKQPTKYLEDPSKFVMLAAPILHGLEMAAQVVDADLAAQLQIRRAKLASEIEQLLPDLSPTCRGLRMYNLSFNPPEPPKAEETQEAKAE